MSYPSVTYTFSNSTTADATQINQNYTDIINGLSDGTKDLSISAITCAGNATFNGNTTIGNASSDTLTLTASLASHLNPSAHNTYDIGTVTTLGMRAIYMASSSATKTAKILGPATSSDIILTLPAYTGTIRNIPSVISSQTSTYSILASDEFIPCSASGGSFTVTLPTAVGATGKVYVIKRTDQTLANAVTIATTSSQTIDGVTSKTLATQYESWTVMSDGSNWQVLDHRYSETISSYTPTISGCGTVSGAAAEWCRSGQQIIVQGEFTTGTVAASEARIALPSGLTLASSTYIPATRFSGRALRAGSITYAELPLQAGAGLTYMTFGGAIAGGTAAGSSVYTSQNGSVIFNNTERVGFQFSVPIAGWEV